MTKKEAKSCEQTVVLLRQLALNIHGFMDIVDERNCEKIIELLKSQPQIVRCKDCIWKNTASCPCKSPYGTKDDWFCANGWKA